MDSTNKDVIGQKCHRIEIILDNSKDKKPVLLISHNEVKKNGSSLIHDKHYDLIMSFGDVAELNLTHE